MDSENCNARPLRVTQSDSRSDELKRRVATATPVRSPMEQGKEPSQRSFELTAHEWVRQEDIAHSPRFAGDFAWRFSGSHADAHGGPRTADYDCLRARFRANDLDRGSAHGLRAVVRGESCVAGRFPVP